MPEFICVLKWVEDFKMDLLVDEMNEIDTASQYGNSWQSYDSSVITSNPREYGARVSTMLGLRLSRPTFLQIQFL